MNPIFEISAAKVSLGRLTGECTIEKHLQSNEVHGYLMNDCGISVAALLKQGIGKGAGS